MRGTAILPLIKVTFRSSALTKNILFNICGKCEQNKCTKDLPLKGVYFRDENYLPHIV